MDILLHLGVHHGGTRAGYRALNQHRGRLLRHGLAVWTPAQCRSGLMQGLYGDPLRLGVADEALALRSIGRMRMQMQDLARSGVSALFVSDPHLIGTPGTNLRQRRLYPLALHRLRRLAPAFEGYRLRVGLGLCSYDRFWTSCLHQRHSGQNPSDTMLDYLTTQPLRWRHLVCDIAAAFPQAQLRIWAMERVANLAHAPLQMLWDGDVPNLTSDADWPPTPTHAVPFNDDQRAVMRADYRADLAWLVAGAGGRAQKYPKKRARTTYAAQP